MADRITVTHLRALVARLNTLTNSPQEPYRQEGDRHRANVGNFHISQAYGGYCLHRMANESGGVTTPLVHGHVPARELYERMHAYIRGLEDGAALGRQALIDGMAKAPDILEG